MVSISPIEKLNYDTLSLILQYAMDIDIDLEDFQAYLSHRVESARPIIHYLGRVSRMWHNVCTSTPSLWRDVVYFVDTPYHAPALQRIRLEAFLQRSQPVNIRLFLCRTRRIPHYLDLWEGDSVQVVLTACKSHMERVEV
jgi:hypothetical protein